MTSVNTFIQHPFSSIKGHMITVNKIIADFEKEAHVGCGLHFEIFEARVLNKVSHASQQMDEKTKEIFLSYAKSKGYDLTEQEEQTKNIWIFSVNNKMATSMKLMKYLSNK